MFAIPLMRPLLMAGPAGHFPGSFSKDWVKAKVRSQGMAQYVSIAKKKIIQLRPVARGGLCHASCLFTLVHLVHKAANESSQEELLLNMGSAKDKHGTRERFGTGNV